MLVVVTAAIGVGALVALVQLWRHQPVHEDSAARDDPDDDPDQDDEDEATISLGSGDDDNELETTS